MENKIAVLAVIVDDYSSVDKVNSLLHEFRDFVVGRMGIPIPEEKISAISLIVKGENEKVSALTGKIGRLKDVNVKSALNNVEI